jgi:hypothetical protein
VEQNLCVDKVPELSRVRRRPLPPARRARLELEVQLYRPHLVRQNIRFEPGELQRIDEERRVPSYGTVPSRAAMIRQLITEAIAFRRANRSPPRPVRGEPFSIDLTWPKDLSR